MSAESSERTSSVQKALVSIAFGLLGVAGTFFTFSASFPPHEITIVWSLFLPMLAALVYGWQYGFLAATLGGAGFFSFILWPTNGWANVVDVFLFVSWFVWHGYASEQRRMRPSLWNNIYIVQAMYSIFFTLLLCAPFSWLFRFNPPFWYPQAATSMPAGVIEGIAVKETIMMYLQIFVCDLLLHLPAIRRFFHLPVPSSLRFTFRIIISSILLGALTMCAYLALEALLLDHDLARIIEHALTDEHRRLSILIVILSLVAGLQLAKYVETRINAEDALRSGEERFRAIYDSLNEALFIHDLNTGAILDVNEKMCEMFGYTREEALRATVGDLSFGQTPYSQEDAVSWIAKAAAGEPQLFEWRAKHKNGRFFWGEVNMRSATIGGKDRVLVAVRDITGRKRMEEALQSEKEFTDTAINTMMGLFYVVDGQGRYIRWNRSLESLWGVREGNLLGKDCLMIIHPEDREFVRRKIEEAFAKGYAETEARKLPAEGEETKYYFLSAKRMTIGEKAYLVGTGIDITERKKTEEAIQKLSQAIEQSPVSVVITDTRGTIEFVNPKFTHITGYAFDEAVGKTPRIMKSGETPAEEYRKLWQAISTGGIWQGEFHNRKKNGELFWEHAVIAPIRNSMGEITHYVSIKEDITEKKKLEEQLSQAQKMEAIGQLAGGVAHDFNNLLTAIIGYGSLLSMELENDAKLKPLVDQILSSAEKSANLTRQLLAFSRKQIISPKETDLNELIRGMEKLLRRLITEDIEIQMELSEKEVTVMVDPGQLEQVIMNLCTNARDAMPQGGALFISTDTCYLDERGMETDDRTHSRATALMTITDTGEGMDENTQQRIFEPFFTTKEVGRGTGLGLSIVYGIISQHKGHITVYSAPGKGTTFSIYLPLIESPMDNIELRKVFPPTRGTETVLIAEDNEEVRDLITQVLQGQGYTTIAAVDGEEALEKFRGNKDKIQLVLLDAIMPKKSGKEAGDVMLKIKPDVKILFLSGYTADIVNRKGILKEGVNFISKPITPNDLLLKIREILDG